MRAIVFISSWLFCVAASAAVTCDQLGNIAQKTEELRNQGESLQALLAEADKLESADNLGKEDMVRVRRTVRESYDRTRTPLEIRQECKDMPGK